MILHNLFDNVKRCNPSNVSHFLDIVKINNFILFHHNIMILERKILQKYINILKDLLRLGQLDNA